MGRLSKRMPWVEFAVAICVLAAVAAASDNVTSRLETEQSWISHTLETETGTAQLRSALFSTEDARQVFVITGDTSSLADYTRAKAAVPDRLADLQRLTADNPSQQAHLAELHELIQQHLGLLQGSIDLRQKPGSDLEQQKIWTEASARLSAQEVDVLREMGSEENRLLVSRQTLSAGSYRRVRLILLISFAFVVLLLTINFYDLSRELNERKRAEEALVRLSGRILQMQDEERRRIARELHDSIGQVFAALKMNLETIVQGGESLAPSQKSELLREAIGTLDEGLAGARTLSHLLHPPLLDELGFASAAKWLVQGFSGRSGIQVKLEVPDDLPRMPSEVELSLFRILQESLTNIHKHSNSKTAEASVSNTGASVTLCVRDFGKGMPLEVIRSFERSRSELGVGLAGMRERVRQLGGRLELSSDGHGATVKTTIPVASASQAPKTGQPAGPLSRSARVGQ